MIALKKLYGEELLRLALMLSLLRADPEQYLRDEARLLAGGLVNGTDRSAEPESVRMRPRFRHPKSLDSILLDYERDVFEELHSLGRWGNSGATREAVQTYLLSGVEGGGNQTTPLTQSTAESAAGYPQSGQLENEDVEQCVTIKTEDSRDSAEEDSSYSHFFEAPPNIVTLSASFIRNLTHFEGPLMEEDSAPSVPFDVSQFFANPLSNGTHLTEIKDEPGEMSRNSNEDELFLDDNAMDDFMPFYMQSGGDSITDQNLADLTDYDETAATLEEFKRSIETQDLKQQQENLEKYLIVNTELDVEETAVVKRERASTSFTSSVGSSSGLGGSSSCSNETALLHDFKSEGDEGHCSGDELTQEDMDLIEVLWKQDVDMGFCLDTPTAASGKCSQEQQDEIDCIKDALKESCEVADTAKLAEAAPPQDDPWAGLAYTVDTETGEYVPTGEERFDLLEEALQLVGLDDAQPDLEGSVKAPAPSPGPAMLAPRYHPHHHPQQHHHAAQHHFAYHHQNLVRSMSMEQRWQDLATLLALPAPQGGAQASPDQLYHQHHPHHPHHPHNVGHAPQGAPSYVAPPYAPLPSQPEKPALAATADIYGAANLGSAVAASMNIPHGGQGGPPPAFYKAEGEHQAEQMYYQAQDSDNMGLLGERMARLSAAGGCWRSQPPPPPPLHNATTELNGTSDGFLSSILNDEDLQLMDMAVNEGMYTMRMLESGAGAAGPGGQQHGPHAPQAPLHPHHHLSMGSERVDASSDSAVSSMGSERVPSLSDGEWCDGGSDSAQDYHSKMRGDGPRAPLVAQKKHHMFGKRCFQEQASMSRLRPPQDDQPPVKFEYEPTGPVVPAPTYAPHVAHLNPELKYSSSREFCGALPSSAALAAQHNHTYSHSLPPAPPQPPHRPLARDKRGRRGPEAVGSCGGPLSRDEKRARALGIPMTVHDIINLPMDEFNERLSKHDLSETQLSLIRDIRRRGKNKVAAQNCRKRKLDQITSLADEVRDARTRKQRLQRDRQQLLAERQRAKEQFAALYRHVFQHLRDVEGNPLSSQQYSLQQAADGAVVLVPRARTTPERHLSSNGTSEDDLERIKMKQRKSFDQ